MPGRLRVGVYDILGALNATDSTNVCDSDHTVQEVITDSAANKVFNNEVLMTLVSDYVDVADVGRFAGINRVTKSVLDTPMFWKKLYKRKRCSNLPPKLQDRAILSHSPRGLRAKVIRAIQYNKQTSNVTNRELKSLVGLSVADVVNKKTTNVGPTCMRNRIYFILKDTDNVAKVDNGDVEEEDDPGEEQDSNRKMFRQKKLQINDLFHNKYEGFRVLRLSTARLEQEFDSVKQQKLKSVLWDRPKEMFVMKFDSGTETVYRVYTEHSVRLFNWWDRGFRCAES